MNCLTETRGETGVQRFPFLFLALWDQRLQFCSCEDLNLGFLVQTCYTCPEVVFDVDCAISRTEIIEDLLQKVEY